MRLRIALYQLVLVAALFAFWYLLTEPSLWPDEFAKRMAFFFGRPIQVMKVVVEWFASGKIYPHLAITLWETVLAFAIGSLLGLGIGLSTVDPAAGDTPEATSLGLGAGIWWVVSNLIALVIGG